MFALESDGVFSRLSVNAPAFGPLFHVPPRLNAMTVGDPDEKSELRMPTFTMYDYRLLVYLLYCTTWKPAVLRQYSQCAVCVLAG